MSPAMARTLTFQSRDKGTKLEATAPSPLTGYLLDRVLIVNYEERACFNWIITVSEWSKVGGSWQKSPSIHLLHDPSQLLCWYSLILKKKMSKPTTHSYNKVAYYKTLWWLCSIYIFLTIFSGLLSCFYLFLKL